MYLYESGVWSAAGLVCSERWLSDDISAGVYQPNSRTVLLALLCTLSEAFFFGEGKIALVQLVSSM